MQHDNAQLSLNVETEQSKFLQEATSGARIYTHMEYHTNFIGSIGWVNSITIKMYFALPADEKRSSPVFVEVEFGSQRNRPDRHFHPGTNFLDQAPSLWLRMHDIDRKEFFRMFDGVGVSCTYDIPYEDDLPVTLNPFSAEWFDVYGFMRAMHCMILERIRTAKFVEDRENLPLDQIMLLAAEKHLNARIIRFFHMVSRMAIFQKKREDTKEEGPSPSDETADTEATSSS